MSESSPTNAATSTATAEAPKPQPMDFTRVLRERTPEEEAQLREVLKQNEDPLKAGTDFLIVDRLAKLKLTGILFAASLATYLSVWFFYDYSLFVVLCVVLILGPVWHRSMRIYRSKVRTELQRKLAMDRLETDVESTEWLNMILQRFWLIYEPVLSETVVASVNPVLESFTPSFIDSISLTEFTLGTTAPRIANVRSYPNTADDVIRFDLDAIFEPKDEDDLSARKGERNSRIVLSTRVGRGMVAVVVPILVKEIAFSATIGIQLRTMPGFPFVKVASVSFPTHPDIRFVLKPLKGMDLMDMPGLSQFLDSTIRDVVGMMFVAPNAFTLDLDSIMNGVSTIESASGVLLIKVYEARDLKNVETVGKSDPYTEIKLNGKVVGKTRVIDDNLDPYWNESFYVLVNSLNDPLELNIYDKDLIKDRQLGTFKSTLKDFGLETNPKTDDITRPLRTGKASKQTAEEELTMSTAGMKTKGEIHFELAYYPVTLPATVSGTDNVPTYLSNSGIMRINIHQAKELDESKSMVGAYNPFVEVRQGPLVLHKTKARKRTNNPQWEDSFEIFIRDINRDKLKFVIRDQRDLAVDIEIGDCEIPVKQIVEMLKPNASTNKIDWWNLRHVSSGKLRLSFLFRHVHFDHPVPPLTAAGRQAYTPAIGVIRIKVVEADGLKNKEAVGTSDPYCKVTYAGKMRAKTAVVDSNLAPMWNETTYLLLQDTTVKGKLSFEIFDFNNLQNDKFMGKATFDLKSLVSGEDKTAVTDMRDVWIPLSSESGKKTDGRLHLQISYYPAIMPALKTIASAETSADASPEKQKPTTTEKETAAKKNMSASEASLLEAAAAAASDDKNQNSEFRQQTALKTLEDIKKYNAGILRVMLHGCELNELAMEAEGYHEEKRPSTYFEFFDPSGSMVSNTMCSLSESLSIKGEGNKGSPIPLTKGFRRQSKDMTNIMKNMAEDNRSGNITMLHRTTFIKDSLNPSFEEEIEFFVRDLDSARLLVLCKDHQSSSSAAKPNEQDEKAPVEIKGQKAIKHKVLGKSDIMVKDALIEESEKRSKVKTNADQLSPGHSLANSTENSPKKTAAWGVHKLISMNPAISTVVGKFNWTMAFSPIEIDEDVLFNDQALEVTNSGTLTVDLIEAANLPAVDSSGTSDPYCRFRLNTEVLHKSKTIKKNNVNPKWNESFTTKLSSRAASRIVIDVRDWNQFEENKLLGLAYIDCSQLKLDETEERTILLVSENGKRVGGPNGQPATLKLRIKFVPDSNISGKRRRIDRRLGHTDSQASETISTSISTINVAAKMLAGNRRRATDSARSSQASLNSPKTPTDPNDPSSATAPPTLALATTALMEKFQKGGVLTVKVIEAKNLTVGEPNQRDSYFKVSMKSSTNSEKQQQASSTNESVVFKSKTAKKTDNPYWDESFTLPHCPVVGEPFLLHIDLHNHSMIGAGELLGTYELDVWKVFAVDKDTRLTDTQILRKQYWTKPGELRGGSLLNQASLHIQLEFNVAKRASINNNINGNNVNSPLKQTSSDSEGASLPESESSPHRRKRSILGKLFKKSDK